MEKDTLLLMNNQSISKLWIHWVQNFKQNLNTLSQKTLLQVKTFMKSWEEFTRMESCITSTTMNKHASKFSLKRVKKRAMKNYFNLQFNTKTFTWQLMLDSHVCLRTFYSSFKWLETKSKFSCVLQWTQLKIKWIRESQINYFSLLMIQTTFLKQVRELMKWLNEKCFMFKFMIDQKNYFKLLT